MQTMFELTAHPSLEKLVNNGLIRVMCRILSHYCTQSCFSNIILWGVGIIHDIAHYCSSEKYHAKIAKGIDGISINQRNCLFNFM